MPRRKDSPEAVDVSDTEHCVPGQQDLLARGRRPRVGKGVTGRAPSEARSSGSPRQGRTAGCRSTSPSAARCHKQRDRSAWGGSVRRASAVSKIQSTWACGPRLGAGAVRVVAAQDPSHPQVRDQQRRVETPQQDRLIAARSIRAGAGGRASRRRSARRHGTAQTPFVHTKRPHGPAFEARRSCCAGFTRLRGIRACSAATKLWIWRKLSRPAGAATMSMNAKTLGRP